MNCRLEHGSKSRYTHSEIRADEEGYTCQRQHTAELTAPAKESNWQDNPTQFLRLGHQLDQNPVCERIMSPLSSGWALRIYLVSERKHNNFIHSWICKCYKNVGKIMVTSRECHPLSQVTNLTWGPLLHSRNGTASQTKKGTTEFVLRILRTTVKWRHDSSLPWGALQLCLTYSIVSTTLKFSGSVSVRVCALLPFRSLPLLHLQLVILLALATQSTLF